MNDYASKDNVLVASAKCQTSSRDPGSGASLCSHHFEPYFPNIMFGRGDSLQAYSGARDIGSLRAFAKQHLSGNTPSPAPPPSPLPPSPSPVPPPPSPASPAHYSDPRTGCLADEIKIAIPGFAGEVCTPKCWSRSCPTDRPFGVPALPECNAYKTCTLVCTKDYHCDYRNGATCAQPGAGALIKHGVCTYPSTHTNEMCMVAWQELQANTTMVV